MERCLRGGMRFGKFSYSIAPSPAFEHGKERTKENCCAGGGAPTLPDSSSKQKPSHWFYVTLCAHERGNLRWWKSLLSGGYFRRIPEIRGIRKLGAPSDRYRLLVQSEKPRP